MYLGAGDQKAIEKCKLEIFLLKQDRQQRAEKGFETKKIGNRTNTN
jgi:hypothetical protein